MKLENILCGGVVASILRLPGAGQSEQLVGVLLGRRCITWGWQNHEALRVLLRLEERDFKESKARRGQINWEKTEKGFKGG